MHTKTATTGQIIMEMEAELKTRHPHDNHPIPRKTLERWMEGVVYAAALLDPDNPPLTHEQLSELKRKPR